MTENEAPKKIVIAYIDASNIILSARRAGLDLDLLRLRQYILDKYRTNEIYYFTPNLKSTKDENEALIKAGFKIVETEPVVEPPEQPILQNLASQFKEFEISPP